MFFKCLLTNTDRCYDSVGGGQVAAACDGWVGHTLDPIECLYRTLTRASTTMDDSAPSATNTGLSHRSVF